MDKQAGFTLIEIIAVLIILGVLAAVAIPKYQDLQQAARQKSLDGAIGAGMSQLTMAYSAENLRKNGVQRDIVWENVVDSCAEVGGDFVINCSGSNPVTITVTDTSGATATGQWNAPT